MPNKTLQRTRTGRAAELMRYAASPNMLRVSPKRASAKKTTLLTRWAQSPGGRLPGSTGWGLAQGFAYSMRTRKACSALGAEGKGGRSSSSPLRTLRSPAGDVMMLTLPAKVLADTDAVRQHCAHAREHWAGESSTGGDAQDRVNVTQPDLRRRQCILDPNVWAVLAPTRRPETSLELSPCSLDKLSC